MGVQSYLNYKYKIDFVAAVLLLTILLPLLLIISIVLLVELKENPLIIQERGLSLTNRRFRIYKFRTLKKNDYKANSNISDIFYKTDLIEYVSNFGWLLRITGFDELPQLLNIIKGEMSFIGPRPFTLDDIKIMKEKGPKVYEMRNKLVTKPGITGKWQVLGVRREGIENLINLELKYEKNVSLTTDIKILFASIRLVMRGKLSDAVLNGFDRKELRKASAVRSISNI